ncbi:MAG: alkaline phosphatase D family protein [Bacteroidales bacterium]|nr:alkaline phosphatase D family protein [Bacteroidales bacterium]
MSEDSMSTQYKILFALSAVVALISSCAIKKSGDDFRCSLPTNIQRVWLGPDYWSNPLQDWQLKNGRIECITSGGDRNVYLLTHELDKNVGAFKMSVRLGQLDLNEILEEGWVGFKIGVKGEFDDYRDNAVRGIGLGVGMTTKGRLFIGGLEENTKALASPFHNIRLEFSAQLAGDNYNAVLIAFDSTGNVLSQCVQNDLDSDWLEGGVALVCSRGEVPHKSEKRVAINGSNWGFRPGTERGGNVRFWFKDWSLSGTKVTGYPEHSYGPILFTQYTLSDNILKMTVQMPPISDKDPQEIRFQIPKGKKNWETLREVRIDPMARIATFRIENWDTSKDIPYRLAYGPYHSGTCKKNDFYEGVIRKEPLGKEEITIAAFTGNNDLGFPNNDVVRNVSYHDPDLLFFSGDQIYEVVGGFGIQRSPVEKATLDYLRKWYIFGWTYRDLLRNRPAICIPDDHDVYQGNLWGAGGKAVPSGLSGYDAQDAGGYIMPPEWINMVQRTQTSNLPDPYDPTPVEQGIGVYYCSLNYAGISFAILEDRKFKSAPKSLLPGADIQNGWIRNKSFNAKSDSDVPEAVLLGERQLNFLQNWASDWSHNTWMKVVLSQTIFSNLCTLPKEEATSDEVTPKLRILEKGLYPPNDIPVADMDSNGWPKTGRNRAIREMRRAFALHIAGDQHLGSTIQYGIDEWRDSGFAFCVPAVSNIWPRRWYPNTAGKNRLPNSPQYTGDFEDGFANKMTVFAVSNPVFTGLKPSRLYDRATGYGLVRFNKETRDVKIECWPRLSDPAQSDSGQYPGWPITINQLDNFTQSSQLFLPRIIITGMIDPVVQVVSEFDGEIIYTIRINGTEFQPKVLADGKYTIKIGEPGTNRMKEFTAISASRHEKYDSLLVEF